MYVVILGCSAVGYYLAKVLLAAGHEVIVIEKNPTRCQLLWNELGSVVIQGDGTDERTLKEAGVARADIFIAVTGLDETNLVACQMAKHVFQVPYTMSLVRDTKNEPVFHVLGINVVVNATHSVVAQLEEGELPPRSFISLVIKKNQASLPSNDLILEAQDQVVAVTMIDEEQTLYE